MCGIVGAIAKRDVLPILVDGLKRLEYRGYDSAGVVVLNQQNCLERIRAQGKVAELEKKLTNAVSGNLGIAHTRWATHGVPSESNAHPHICNNVVSIVHNGIIENHEALREQQLKAGYHFSSETDSEVIVHEVHASHVNNKLPIFDAVQAVTKKLDGAFALGVVSANEPDLLIAARNGCPLVIGVGDGEHFIASDIAALLPVTRRFIFLEDGDVAELSRDNCKIIDVNGHQVDRPIIVSKQTSESSDKGQYKHYMLKEIFEQTNAVAETLEGRISGSRVMEEAFGVNAKDIFDEIEGVHIIACGTSYHSGLIGKYWFESIAGIPCSVEVASEFRYRRPIVRNKSLIVTISQSGETADTLAGLRESKRLGFGRSLAICNVPESSLVRESDLIMMTHAGPEIGVASTKAFTTQLVALILLVIVLGRRRNVTDKMEADFVKQLLSLPKKIDNVLKLDKKIKAIAEQFANKQHALFLGRGTHYPVAMEGALKLKEISYIHAEAYPAGELKHGPLALIDENMPVIAVAPNNELLGKLKSNLQEVSARGGKLIVFADSNIDVKSTESVQVLEIASVEDLISPIIYTIPLQLLAYHVAVLKGTDIDQPRNLAKSVTVE
ncbi:MAG: glutamine--fructose-6-phosphate transaminase (isomerizing) [Gammaproteobacteria bacterium]|nr:glutamine--fructose-6-phosphate transaminase (isomerizing) [Gammaproteobacteria bacterium]